MSLLGRRFPTFMRGYMQQRLRSGYVVLLPENPPEELQNSLIPEGDLPVFEDLTSTKCWNGITQIASEYEDNYFQFIEKLKDPTYKKSFENIIDEIDLYSSPMNHAMSTITTLYTTRNDLLPVNSYTLIHERTRIARTVKYMNVSLYEACKNLMESENETLDVAQKRVLQKYIMEGQLNGIDLASKPYDLFNKILIQIDGFKDQYGQNMVNALKKFSLKLNKDSKITKDFPDDLLQNMAVDRNEYKTGPWEVTLYPQVFNDFMKYCPDQAMRFVCYRAKNMLCSSLGSKDLDNSILIFELRQQRALQAVSLGYKTFGDLSMMTKMAGTVGNVNVMMDTLHSKVKDAHSKEMLSLQEFAKTEGFTDNFKISDVPYYRRLQKTALYGIDDTNIKEYFPFEHVWSELLILASGLFNISFEQVVPQSQNIWHKDVRYFKVYEQNGTYITSFFLDPYLRPHQKLLPWKDSSWMLGLSSNSKSAKSLPICSLIYNFEPPTEQLPSLLNLDEVKVLFQQFGLALQHVLTTVPYGDAAGVINIEWDAVGICKYFMGNWVYEPNVLECISKHYKTGEALSKSDIQNIINSRSHLAAYDICSNLYLSDIDMTAYTTNDYYLKIINDKWKKYFDFPVDKMDRSICSFSEIFNERYPAAYFSFIWSEMVAADAFLAFKEVESPEEVNQCGKRFRETFLSLGGGCHPSDVFRQFRGRDPSVEAIVKLYGIS